jgi:hypothetical protein
MNKNHDRLLSEESSLLAEDTWVNVTEAAKATGYNRDHMQKLARDNWNLPAEERKMRVKRHSNGYMIWLPDLLKYIETDGVGPYKKRESTG